MQEYGFYIFSAYGIVFLGLIYITIRYLRLRDR